MKQVIIVVPEGNVNLSSISGSFEILNRANGYWKKKGNHSKMEIQIGGFIDTLELGNGFFAIHPVQLDTLGPVDLIIIPSLTYDYAHVLINNTALIEWIAAQYKTGAEIASICTGAFLLAATGLIDGKSCSTHWNAATDFKRLFPEIDLQIDKLIAVEDGIYSNGGAYSFLNLMLFLVEKYFDRDTAIFCSKVFQIDIDRHTQSPFFIFKAQKNHGDDVVLNAQKFIEENLSEKISFEDLSIQLNTSRRNFDRRFIKATGNTPVEYLQRVKIEAAKRLLELGRKNINEVMYEVGYADDKAFREIFKRLTGLSPIDYKQKFNREVVFGI